MNILAKFKETAYSVLPVMVIVLALGWALDSKIRLLGLAEPYWLVRFSIGGLLLILGLAIFLLGIDIGIQPFGHQAGSGLTRKRNLPLLLGAAFVIGLVVTAAEPDIQVFGDQVRGEFPWVDKMQLVLAGAAGIGLFMVVALLRILMRISIKKTLLVSYAVLLALSFFSPTEFLGVAFDSGGATTGPMTVPFIMAIGLGVASARSKGGDSGFGLTGIASIGPILAVLLYGIILRGPGTAAPDELAAATGGAGGPAGTNVCLAVLRPFLSAIGPELHESVITIAPLLALFFLFQVFLLKMTPLQFTHQLIGFFYAFIGLAIFLVGVQGGFMQAGQALGRVLGELAGTAGGGWYVLLIGTGLLFGAIIVCAEPAVWVLSEQVEHVSGGHIRRKALLVFLSVGTALAIGLALWRAVAGFHLAYLLLPGYLLAMALMLRCPPLFVAIAFDSGGVASGPLTSTFILSFTLGAAAGGDAGDDTFGVIALVAMMPLIAVQLMGVLYERARRKAAPVHGKETTNEP